MILDASCVAHVDLLRRAALRFGGEDRVTPFVEESGALASVAVEDAGTSSEPARRLYESLGGALAAQGPTLNYRFPLR